jgi:hypothetical protein
MLALLFFHFELRQAHEQDILGNVANIGMVGGR